MKAKYYLMMAASTLLLSNCSQEETLNQVQSGTKTLTATIEGSSRSAVTDGGVFSWTVGDAISVWNGSKCVTYTNVSGNSFSTEDTDPGTPTGYAIYPANDGYQTMSTPETVKLPATYGNENVTYVANTNAPMLATIADGSNSLSFKHLAGVMRFVVKNVPENVTSFKFTANKKITGDFDVADGTDDHKVINVGEESESDNTVTINFAAPAEASTMTFYVPLPVGEYGNYTVTVGDKSHLSENVANTIARGTLLLMPVYTYSDSGLIKDESGSYVAMEGGEQTLATADGEVLIDAAGLSGDAEAVLNLNYTPSADNATLTISDGSDDDTESSASVATVNVYPQGDEEVETLTINAPTLTVNLAAGTYGTVEAKTATNTLIIGKDVTIGTLTVNGGNIKLDDNATINSLTIPEDVEMTINLNGKILTINSGTNGIVNNGTLTISNGTITHSAATNATNWTAGDYTNMTAAIRNNATVTLTGVSITSNVYTVNNYGTWNNEGSQKVTDQEVTATLTISGGTYKSSKDKNSDPNGPNAYSIMCVDNAKAIISGGASIEGAGGGLAVCWANAELDDCTLTGNNQASTGAHDLYMIGGSQVTYTDNTELTHSNMRLQDVSATGSSYVDNYGACSFVLKVSDSSSLETALNAGQSVQLTTSMSLSSSLTVDKNSNVTIDLNNNTLTLASKNDVNGGNGIVNNGTLTIKNGDINFSAIEEKTNWEAGKYSDMTAAIRNNATAILTGVSITSNVYTVNNYGDWDEDGSQKVTDQKVTATLTITGGTYTSSKDKNSAPTGPNAYSIMCVDNAKAIISGDATIKGAGGGLAVCWANAELDDCTLTGNNQANTGAHDLYLIGGSQVTYTDNTELTHSNMCLQDVSATGSSYVDKYGTCSYTKK